MKCPYCGNKRVRLLDAKAFRPSMMGDHKNPKTSKPCIAAYQPWTKVQKLLEDIKRLEKRRTK